MTPVGGLRARLLHDSLQHAVHAGLDDLHWFDSDRSHRPIEFLAEPSEWDHEIRSNSLVVTARSRTSQWFELGSNLSRDTITMGVDIYGESEALASHLANDIRDLLRGHLTVGPRRGSVPILDFTMATPAPVGYAVIANVRATRLPPQTNRPYTQFWFGVDAELLDTYYAAELGVTWPSPSLFPSDALFPSS